MIFEFWFDHGELRNRHAVERNNFLGKSLVLAHAEGFSAGSGMGHTKHFQYRHHVGLMAPLAGECLAHVEHDIGTVFRHAIEQWIQAVKQAERFNAMALAAQCLHDMTLVAEDVARHEPALVPRTVVRFTANVIEQHDVQLGGQRFPDPPLGGIAALAGNL